MTAQELNTKIKILQVAHKLFADKGKNGVAVREIATAADVNVAAINYHFGNKDSLYAETIKSSLTKMSTDIGLLYNDNCSLEILVNRIFDYFIRNREDLTTGFKLFLNSDSSDAIFGDKTSNPVGPPGGEVMYKCVLDNHPNTSEEDILWIVRTLFTQVVHNSLMICNHCTNLDSKLQVNEESLKFAVLRLTRILIREIE
jgi:AcrR family transcriptional regulator